jgi:UTP--glucose-1-phosphate uridylyltransferase
MKKIKKAIIPIAGLGTRFLPLSKIMPKEMWPLVDIPPIHYVVKEAKDSGIEEIIFVLRQDNKKVLDYLKPCTKTEKLLKEKKRNNLLEDLKSLQNLCDNLSFSYVLQKKPLGDGHAILQASKNIKDEAVACMFPDDIFDAQEPVTLQLSNIFKTCEKPVIALNPQPKEKISSYGIAGVEKIANKLYKIKKIIEKPAQEEAPSNLAVAGRYILTPEVFSYLKKAKPGKNGEIILAEVFEKQMIAEGKLLYGFEFSGNWLECGDKLKWLKSHLYLSLNHPKYGPELKEYLKTIKYH